MKKRLAIVINGHLRTWTNAKASLYEFVRFLGAEANLDVRVFVNTWSDSYIQSLGVDEAGIKKLIRHEFKHSFNPKTLTPQLLAEISVCSPISSKSAIVHDKQQLKSGPLKLMTWDEEHECVAYLRYLSIKALSEFETENKFEFDYVMFSRPDLWYYLDKPKLKELLSEFVFPEDFEIFVNGLPEKHNRPNWGQVPIIPDFLWLCNRFTATLVADEIFAATSSNFVFPKGGHITQSLYYLTRSFRVKNRLYSILSGATILRPSAVASQEIDLATHSLETFAAIDRDFREFKLQ